MSGTGTPTKRQHSDSKRRPSVASPSTSGTLTLPSTPTFTLKKRGLVSSSSSDFKILVLSNLSDPNVSPFRGSPSLRFPSSSGTSVSEDREPDLEPQLQALKHFNTSFWQHLIDRLLFPIQDVPIPPEVSTLLNAVFDGTQRLEAFLSRHPPPGDAVVLLCEIVVSTYQAMSWLLANSTHPTAIDSIVRFQFSELPLPFFDVDSNAIFSWWTASTFLFGAFAKHAQFHREPLALAKAYILEYYSVCKVAVMLLVGAYLPEVHSSHNNNNNNNNNNNTNTITTTPHSNHPSTSNNTSPRIPSDKSTSTSTTSSPSPGLNSSSAASNQNAHPLNTSGSSSGLSGFELQLAAYEQHQREVERLVSMERDLVAIPKPQGGDCSKGWFLSQLILPFNAVFPAVLPHFLSLIDLLEPSLVSLLFNVEVQSLRSVLLSVSPLAHHYHPNLTEALLLQAFKPIEGPSGNLLARKYIKLERVLIDLSSLIQFQIDPLIHQQCLRLLRILHCYSARLLLDIEEVLLLTPSAWEICSSYNAIFLKDLQTLTSMLAPASPYTPALKQLLSFMIVNLRFTLHSLGRFS